MNLYLPTPEYGRKLLCAVLTVGALAPTTRAFDFSVGEVEARLDLTVSIGGSYRINDPKPALFGPPAGEQYSVNADDGNLNYAEGWVSIPAILTADLELRYQNSGAFFRASAFYDYVNEEEERERTPLSSEALDRVGSRFDMLDAYLWTNLDLGSVPVNLRLGRQVLNWGESTFIQNGINVINPVDVSKIRLPGSELRDALLPIWMASVSAGLTEDITIEAFYQLAWDEVIIDPPGTYFSTNDFVGRGGDKVYLGFGSIADNSPYGYIPRGKDSKPSDSGQFGLATRIYAPNLNGTEFGLYFMNYHSRVPVLGARTPTTPINQNLTGPLTQVLMLAGLPAAQAQAQAAGIFQLLTILQTQGPGALTAQQLATLQAESTQAAISNAQRLALLASAATGRYLVEYPEDIKLAGASFNTDVGNTGISLQGEVSYRWDQPLQIDDVELLFAALSSIYPPYGQINQIGNYAGQLDTYVRGWVREDVWQAQVTATKIFGSVLGSSQTIVVAEVGATWIPDLPGKDELRFEAPGTYVGGNQDAQDTGAQPATEPASSFADDFSWGYRVVGKLDYNNAFMSMNISPIVQFAHDVGGTTPQPIGNFVEHRKSITLAIEATYQNSWVFNLSYTNYYGAGRFNLIDDRDFISATLKYSF